MSGSGQLVLFRDYYMVLVRLGSGYKVTRHATAYAGKSSLDSRKSTLYIHIILSIHPCVHFILGIFVALCQWRQSV